MRKLAIIIALAFFGFVPTVVMAYDLTLTSVGSQSTLGTDYGVVSYTGGIPKLVGTASPSASVGVNINSLLKYATASTSGVWEFVPTALNEGNNSVVLSSGSQSISFTLRFNSTISGEVATPATVIKTELLDSGVWEYYILAVLLGILVLGIGRYGKKWMQKWEKGD